MQPWTTVLISSNNVDTENTGLQDVSRRVTVHSAEAVSTLKIQLTEQLYTYVKVPRTEVGAAPLV